MVLQYKRSDNVVSRELGGQTVLIPIQQQGIDVQSIYALNGTAEDVWEMLAAPSTLEAIVAKMAEEYNASGDLIRNDIVTLLNEMVEENVVISFQGNQN